MIKREITYFFTALMFFTRIPCPTWIDHSPQILNKSRKYFPFVGWIVGAIGGLVLYGLAQILPLSVSLILSIGATVWITGAFHEDGFADVCDGFGGGWTKEQILTIMKDSRLGTYGVIGLMILLAIKTTSLYEIASEDLLLASLTMFSGHALSRYISSTLVNDYEYVQDIDKSKVKPIANDPLSRGERLYGFIWGVLPLAIWSEYPFLIGAAGIAYLSKFYFGWYFKKHIGGYTGDCLGALQQVSEVIYYVSLIVLWNLFS